MKLDEKVVAILDWLDERYDAVAGGKASRAWYALFIVSVPLLFVLCVCRWVFEAYRNFIFGNPDVTPPQRKGYRWCRIGFKPTPEFFHNTLQ